MATEFFRGAENMKKPFAEIRDRLPQPVCDEHPEFTELYWAAWKLAYDHVRHIPCMPQDPYISVLSS